MNNSPTYIAVSLTVAITFVVISTRYLRLHAFFALLIAAFLFSLVIGKSIIDSINLMQQGFGNLLQQIGFLVVLGSCLGILLEKTGAMETSSQKVVSLFGPRNSTLAMTCIGLLVGIPVFCDSGFIILSRLIPSIATQASVNPAQLSLALSSGLYTTHVLVPPTPGPLAAAANLNISEHLSTVILITMVASIPVALVSFYFSKKLGTFTLESLTHNKSESKTISSSKALLPLLTPILLIALGSLPSLVSMSESLAAVLKTAGHPVVALSIGLLFAMLLIQKKQLHEYPEWIGTAIKDAGVILLITGAGGAFGAVIKTSGIDSILNETMSGASSHGIFFLVIAFLLAAILKTAQGSSTSAIIITSSLLSPLALASGFETPAQLSVLVVAIGGGAMTVSHANDSYFWVVSQFSGIVARDAFRSFTVITMLQGVTALLTAILLFQFV